MSEQNVKKVRKLIALAIQCPKLVFTSEELYEIKKLCDYIEVKDKIKRLHAVGCTCYKPLFGERSGGRLRCRICNVNE